MMSAENARYLASRVKKISLSDFKEALDEYLNTEVKNHADGGNLEFTFNPHESFIWIVSNILPTKLGTRILAEDLKNLTLESVIVAIDNLCILNGYQFSKIDDSYFNISWKEQV